MCAGDLRNARGVTGEKQRLDGTQGGEGAFGGPRGSEESYEVLPMLRLYLLLCSREDEGQKEGFHALSVLTAAREVDITATPTQVSIITDTMQASHAHLLSAARLILFQY